MWIATDAGKRSRSRTRLAVCVGDAGNRPFGRGGSARRSTPEYLGDDHVIGGAGLFRSSFLSPLKIRGRDLRGGLSEFSRLIVSFPESAAREARLPLPDCGGGWGWGASAERASRGDKFPHPPRFAASTVPRKLWIS